MKKIILILFLVSRLNGATFELRDGTIVEGNVSDINTQGIIIKTLDNKTYVHHFPCTAKSKTTIENGDGTYTTIQTPVRAAPSLRHVFHRDIHCTPSRRYMITNDLLDSVDPARIEFRDFSDKTLNKLYIHLSKLIKSYNLMAKNNHKFFWDYHRKAEDYKILRQALHFGFIDSKEPVYKKNTLELNEAWSKEVKKYYHKTWNQIEWRGN